MITRVIASIVSALLLMSSGVQAGNTHRQDVQQEINSLMADKHVPGMAVELFVDGKASGYYVGVADREQKKPITAKTIFELGSLTKLMTCLLLAEEVDSAKMQLGDAITKYLPQLPAEYEDIVLQSLATHTSGLPFRMPKNVTSLTMLVKYLQTHVPTEEPNEEWRYSNLGLGLLGIIIEKVEHQDLNTLYRKKILDRLGMQPIGFTVTKPYQPYYATGYDRADNIVANKHENNHSGAVGVKASANDMRKFLEASIGLMGTPERILYPIRMMQAPYVTTNEFMQGLGWEVHEISGETVDTLLAAKDADDILKPKNVTDIEEKPVFNKNNLIDKSGMTKGFSSYIAVIPGKKTGIVILTNKAIPMKDVVAVGRRILFSVNHIHTPQQGM